MTTLEKEALETLINVRELLWREMISMSVFTDTMNNIRRLIRSLENLQGGCPTGLHMSDCLCKTDAPSKSIAYAKALHKKHKKGTTNEPTY